MGHCLNQNIIEWLLKGDPSIRWQTLHDLTNSSPAKIKRERAKIAFEGWGKRLLDYQDSSGLWSRALYSPKWISTTYTMMLLRRIGLDQQNQQAQKACEILFEKGIYKDCGINYIKSFNHSETCITGMVLSILSYFKFDGKNNERLVGFLRDQQMKDGGWNCQSHNGAIHSSFHTTISVLEGVREFEKNFPSSSYDVAEVQEKGREFLLEHKLFKSHRTDEVFDPRMTRFSFPPRWKYDVLRSLDYFQECNADKDERLHDAIEIVKKRMKKDGRWNLQNRHPGRTFFEMEEPGKPSRWNTLRALRALKWWEDTAV